MVEKVQKKVASEEKMFQEMFQEMFQVNFLQLFQANLLPVDVAS